MKITNITNSQQLHDAYTDDKQSRFTDYIDGVGIVKWKWCTKLIVLERNGKPIATDKWFITHTNNELIYNAKGDWVNLDMFDKSESYCKTIMLFEEESSD